MDEGTDRPLLVQELCGVGHVRAEACSQNISGAWLILRVWFCSCIQNASLARNNKANRFTGQGPNGTRLARTGSGPSRNQCPTPRLHHTRLPFLSPERQRAQSSRQHTVCTFLYASSSSQGQK